MSTDAQVVVVGGGPVGLMSALGLAKAGVSVTVIEAEAGIIDSPRALAYAWPILDGLDLAGVLDDMADAGSYSFGVAFNVLATGETIFYDHSCLVGHVERPVSLLLGQNRLAGVILRHLERYPNVEILWSTRVTALDQDDDSVTVTATREDGSELRLSADWVIGADGGRSTVRKSLGLELEGITWPERFVATNIRCDFSRAGYRSGYVIDPQHGAVLFQITEDGLWRFTFSEDASLPKETIEERIEPALRTLLPDSANYELTLWSGYSMHQRSAPRYRVGRVLLAGDSAHVTNPTSGFGLMGGLYDVFLLTETLAAVIDGSQSPDILDRYASARRDVFLNFTSPASVESMRLVFHSDDPVRLEQDLQTLRDRKKDRAAMRAFLSAPRALETPSLISGLTLRQRLEQSRAGA